MKKAGIITINDFNNYGNRLQNYALQTVINRIGIDAVNILNNNIPIKGNKEKFTIKKIIIMLINFVRREKHYNTKRKEKFEYFNNKYMKNSKETIIMDNVPNNLHEQYDYIVIGSDQVWNYKLDRISKIDFALFSPKEKNISYAASFGISEISDEWKGKYIQGLNNISHISVRETRGAEIVKELVNREAQVVLDPTLLLNREEWKKIEKKPDQLINKKFIVTYFLGKLSKERKKRINEIGKKYDLKIINLGKLKYHDEYTAGPCEFLWYIKNAEIVFTDSFHACVFSIIFDRTFYIMEREENITSMNSRIDTLLDKFKLRDRKFKDWNEVKLEHNYSHVQPILEKEQEKSIKFLKDALGVE